MSSIVSFYLRLIPVTTDVVFLLRIVIATLSIVGISCILLLISLLVPVVIFVITVIVVCPSSEVSRASRQKERGMIRIVSIYPQRFKLNESNRAIIVIRIPHHNGETNNHHLVGNASGLPLLLPSGHILDHPNHSW